MYRQNSVATERAKQSRSSPGRGLVEVDVRCCRVACGRWFCRSRVHGPKARRRRIPAHGVCSSLLYLTLTLDLHLYYVPAPSSTCGCCADRYRHAGCARDVSCVLHTCVYSAALGIPLIRSTYSAYATGIFCSSSRHCGAPAARALTCQRHPKSRPPSRYRHAHRPRTRQTCACRPPP